MLAPLPRWLGVFALFAALAVAAISGSASADPASPGPSASPPVLVTIVNYAFKPASITVLAGTTVEWRNDDSVSHTATSSNGAFDSQNLDHGGVYKFTFNKPGTYQYICSYHPQMVGTVVVTGPK
ncbi:MAG TPA: cupredoxin family copper-binding protein [Candidatus Eremiobacteraceae bacterium]|nr:cupredoxin family copper-binding protein [Candidatus Eremiobacteraceae bacterium]